RGARQRPVNMPASPALTVRAGDASGPAVWSVDAPVAGSRAARRLQRPGQPGSLVRVDDHGPIGPGTNGHVEFSIAGHVAHGESTYKQYLVDVMDHERSRSLLRPHDNVVVVDEDHVEEAVAVDVGQG